MQICEEEESVGGHKRHVISQMFKLYNNKIDIFENKRLGAVPYCASRRRPRLPDQCGKGTF